MDLFENGGTPRITTVIRNIRIHSCCNFMNHMWKLTMLKISFIKTVKIKHVSKCDFGVSLRFTFVDFVVKPPPWEVLDVDPPWDETSFLRGVVLPATQ